MHSGLDMRSRRRINHAGRARTIERQLAPILRSRRDAKGLTRQMRTTHLSMPLLPPRPNQEESQELTFSLISKILIGRETPSNWI